jgi:penicillin-insensitive murein DD-endopeptidase
MQMRVHMLKWLILILECTSMHAIAQASTCFGKVQQGRLKEGVKLPASGINFSAYSALGSSLGRTYVHAKVEKIVTGAYATLAQTQASKKYVYGETGLAQGGRFRPHRTHQNGTSVDFMVPVLDANGRSVPLPTSALDKFGYSLEFDAQGKLDGLRIDFEAIAEHLFALHIAAKSQGVTLSLVIFDPPYLPMLFATQRGAWLQQNIPFMKGNAWVRHDEHYHVDFGVPCKPL